MMKLDAKKTIEEINLNYNINDLWDKHFPKPSFLWVGENQKIKVRLLGEGFVASRFFVDVYYENYIKKSELISILKNKDIELLQKIKERYESKKVKEDYDSWKNTPINWKNTPINWESTPVNISNNNPFQKSFSNYIEKINSFITGTKNGFVFNCFCDDEIYLIYLSLNNLEPFSDRILTGITAHDLIMSKQSHLTNKWSSVCVDLGEKSRLSDENVKKILKSGLYDIRRLVRNQNLSVISKGNGYIYLLDNEGIKNLPEQLKKECDSVINEHFFESNKDNIDISQENQEKEDNIENTIALIKL